MHFAIGGFTLGSAERAERTLGGGAPSGPSGPIAAHCTLGLLKKYEKMNHGISHYTIISYFRGVSRRVGNNKNRREGRLDRERERGGGGKAFKLSF